MTARSVASVVVVGVGLLASATAQVQAQSAQPDLSTLMRTQMLEIWRAKTPDGSRILIDPPSDAQLPTISPFTLVTQIEQQIGSQLSSLPLGSSSGGFTYSYDASLGTFTRTTETFGPAFAERAQTLGRGRLNVGASYQHSRYASLDGRSLDGEIKFILPPGTVKDPAFANVIESELHLGLTSDTTTVFATAGLTDRLDVGVAVPFQRVSMDLRSRATIRDFSTSAVSPPSRVFANGAKTQDYETRASSAGIGDVVLRTKYKLTRPGLRDLGLAVDFRLPTGDAANLRGTGKLQTQVLLVSSYSSSRIDPHFNIGYTFTDKRSTDHINYVAGLEVAATGRLTLIGDIIGQTFLETFRLADSLVTITQTADSTSGTPALRSTAFGTVEPQTGPLRSVLGTVGFKFTPTRSILISAHVLATMTEAGLRRRLTPVIGLDYSF